MDVPVLAIVRGLADYVEMVGSRVTCKPAPVDTDQDVLVYCGSDKLNDLLSTLSRMDFKLDGSNIRDPREHLTKDDTFQSFSNDKLNFIITSDELFFNNFMAATSVAKRLNLLDKADRIALFQAVLYGNPCGDK